MNRNIYDPTISDIHKYLKEIYRREKFKLGMLSTAGRMTEGQKRRTIIAKTLFNLTEKAAKDSNPGGLFQSLKNL